MTGSIKTEKPHQSTAAIMQALAPYAETISNAVAAYAVSTSMAAAFIANRAIQELNTQQATQKLPIANPSNPKWGKIAEEHAKLAAESQVIHVASDRFAENAAINTMTQEIMNKGVSDHGVARGLASDLVKSGDYNSQNELFQALMREGKSEEDATRSTHELTSNKDQTLQVSAQKVEEARQDKALQNRPQNSNVFKHRLNPTAKNEKVISPDPMPSPGGPGSGPVPSGPGM